MSQTATIEKTPHANQLSFAWDRHETAEGLRRKLAAAPPDQWADLAAWILREARVPEVWDFITPEELAKNWDLLEPRLGRRRDLWAYLIKTWRELGKL
jgi:hypothetical protein